MSPWTPLRLAATWAFGLLGLAFAIEGHLVLAVVMWVVAIAWYHLPI